MYLDELKYLSPNKRPQQVGSWDLPAEFYWSAHEHIYK